MTKRHRKIVECNAEAEAIQYRVQAAAKALKERLTAAAGSQIKAANEVKAFSKTITTLANVELRCFWLFFRDLGCRTFYSKTLALDRALQDAAKACSDELVKRGLVNRNGSCLGWQLSIDDNETLWVLGNGRHYGFGSELLRKVLV